MGTLKKLPKAELHIHLTGSYPLSYLQSIATDAAAQDELQNFMLGLAVLAKGVPYEQAFKYFAPVERLVNTCDKVENGMVALGKELLADGVVYAEIRTGLKDLGGGSEEYLRAVLRGIARCPQGLQIKLLLSLRRSTSAALAKETVDLAIRYKDQGVVGIDISGDSTLGDIAVIIPQIQRAKAAGLYLTLHLGESFKEIDTPEKEIAQAAVLQELQPDRIGHGVFLSPPALQWVLNHPRVPIEVCPTSSVLAGMVNHHSEHPGVKYFLEHQHPIVAGADDLLLFQTTLSAEYNKLMELEGISLEQIQQMILWSFEYAFSTPRANKVSYPLLKSRM